MEQQTFIQHLIQFGLTRQEGLVYTCLLTEGKHTGYEVAKATGISRSNAYTALSALAEKGAAYVVEENAKKYIPVPLEEFCGNYLRQLSLEKEWLLSHKPRQKSEEAGYITVEGAGNIINKIKNMLISAEERVYLSAGHENLEVFRQEIEKNALKKKKIVIITDRPAAIPGVKVYLTEEKKNQIGVITDSKYVLTGEYGENSLNTCLYSGHKNFVELFKNAMANEIKLIGYTKRRKLR